MAGRTPVQRILERATAAAQGRRLDEASALLEQVLADDDVNLRALDLLGFVRYFQGRPAEAESCCRRALAVDPDHAYAHKGLGLCLAKQGRVDEGVASLERAMSLSPGWFDPYWDLCVVLLEARRFGEVREVARRGAAAVPSRAADLLGLVARLPPAAD
jgi:tetratricopeptide (TPR) repeat protein